MVKCPKCPGIIKEVLPGDNRPKKAPRHPQGLDAIGILECWEAQKRIVKPEKNTDASTGKAKDAKPGGRRTEQEPPGFKERLRVEMERLGGFPKVVGVKLTRENDVWLQQTASRYRCDQSIVLRAAVMWFLREQPAFDKPKVRSNWKSRRSTTVKFKPAVWAALRAVAEAHHFARTGTALSMIVDYCRRKRIDVVGLT